MTSPKIYRIGYVARLIGVNSSAIRFWEGEFRCLPSRRSAKGQRFYTDEDIKTLQRIKFLLHDRKLTLEGARRQLAEDGHFGRLDQAPDTPADTVEGPAYPPEGKATAAPLRHAGQVDLAKEELASVAEELKILASTMLERAACI